MDIRTGHLVADEGLNAIQTLPESFLPENNLFDETECPLPFEQLSKLAEKLLLRKENDSRKSA